MKIRSKIIFLELSIAIILFFSLIIMIQGLSNSMKMEQIRLYYHSNFSSLDDLERALDDMVYSGLTFDDSMKSLKESIDNYTQVNTLLKRTIEGTRLDVTFKKELLQSENKITSNLSKEVLERYLQFYNNIRQLDTEHFLDDASISVVYTYLSEHNKTDSELFKRIDEFYKEIVNQQTLLNDYQQILWEELGTSENKFLEYRKRVIILATINAFVFIAAVLLAVLLFSNSIVRRIRKIDRAFEIVATGDFSTHLTLNSDDEFGTLTRNFNSLVDSLWTKMETMRQIMHDVGDSISNEIDLTKVENTIVYLAKKNTTADGVALYKVIEDGNTLRLQYGIGNYRPPYKSQLIENASSAQKANLIPLMRQETVSLRGNIIGETAIQAKPQFIKNIGLNRPQLKKEPTDPLYVSSCISIPLRIGNKILGVLALVKTKPYAYFSDLEYSNMQSFAELSAISIDNLNKYSEMLEAFELNREIGIASEIQQNLLPSNLPPCENYDISFMYKPLKGINGDFFDVIPLGYDKMLIAVCEVAGKGVPAALVMVMIRTILRLIASPEKDAGTILTELNRNITERVQIENFASIGVIILNKKNNNISFSGASHHALNIFRSNSGKNERTHVGGIPVGIDQDTEYPTQDVLVEPGDILSLYTDGIPEARNKAGKEYTSESLLDIIERNKDADTEELIAAVDEDITFFEKGAQIYDDKTLFILKYTGETDEN